MIKKVAKIQNIIDRGKPTFINGTKISGISTSQYRDYVLGNNATVQLKASHEKGLITAIALELFRWVH